MRKSPTRSDVAQRAGVSEAVVSYVMNDGPRPVSESARARVLAAVEHLGYRPNQLARALRSNRSRSIGLLVPDALNPFFGELTQHIERVCQEQGYMLIIGTTSNDPDRESHYLEAFAERQVDGMIVISSASDWPHARGTSVRIAQTPLVLVDRTPERATGAVAKSDNALGAEAAVRHLLESHGKKRILLLAGPPGLDSTRARIEGAMRAITDLPDSQYTLVHSDFSFEAGYEVTAAAVSDEVSARNQAGELHSKPGETEPAAPFDALFALSDVQAIGAIRALNDAGISVPGDTAVVSFDGTELSKYSRPSLTSVEQDVEAIAHAAMDRLTKLIENSGEETELVFDPVVQTPRLLRRESCGCKLQPR